MNEIFLKGIDSTNTYAKKHCSTFSPNAITCIVAEEQTAGRGQFERKWVSPPGVNIYATFYFQLSVTCSEINRLAQLLTLSIATVLNAAGVVIKIKWPNDILIQNKKIAGVLCETTPQKDHMDVFCGFGLNVNSEEAMFQNIDQPATSLKLATNKTWDRGELLKKIQNQFASDLGAFKQWGFAQFQDRLVEFLLPRTT